jgi:hypothetical protein
VRSQKIVVCALCVGLLLAGCGSSAPSSSSVHAAVAAALSTMNAPTATVFNNSFHDPLTAKDKATLASLNWSL